MKTIKEIIEEHVPGQYLAQARGYVDDVVKALVDRDLDIANKLMDKAMSAGYDVGEVREALVAVGLLALTEQQEDELQERVNAIEEAMGEVARALTAVKDAIAGR